MLLFDELSDITKLLAQEHGYNQARAGHDVVGCAVCSRIEASRDVLHLDAEDEDMWGAGNEHPRYSWGEFRQQKAAGRLEVSAYYHDWVVRQLQGK